MNQYGLAHPRYETAGQVGRDLRRLGYDVSARRSQPWTISPRDKLELVEFARDYKQAYGREILWTPTATQFMDALQRASENPADWLLRSLHPASCCTKCHNAFEELRVFPFLATRERDRLLEKHEELTANPDPVAHRQHARDEMVIFRAAGVPKRLLDAVEVDHRAMFPRERFSNAA